MKSIIHLTSYFRKVRSVIGPTSVGPIKSYWIATTFLYLVSTTLHVLGFFKLPHQNADVLHLILILVLASVSVSLGSRFKRFRFKGSIGTKSVAILASSVILVTSALLYFYDLPIESDSSGFQLLQERILASRRLSGGRWFLHILYTLLNYTAVPVICIFSYLKCPKFFIPMLLAATFTVSLYAAKSSIILITLPLIAATVKSKNYLHGFALIFYTIGYFSITFNLFYPKHVSTTIGDSIEISNEQLKASETNFLYRFSNRIFRIQSSAALEWLEYFRLERNSQFYKGTTIPILGELLTESSERERPSRDIMQSKHNNENQVSGDSTSHFALDAYVNFGYSGVVIYGLIIGFAISFLYSSKNTEFSSLAYGYSVWVTLGDLPGLMSIGGLFFLLIFGLLSTRFSRSASIA